MGKLVEVGLRKLPPNETFTLKNYSPIRIHALPACLIEEYQNISTKVPSRYALKTKTCPTLLKLSHFSQNINDFLTVFYYFLTTSFLSLLLIKTSYNWAFLPVLFALEERASQHIGVHSTYKLC